MEIKTAIAEAKRLWGDQGHAVIHRGIFKVGLLFNHLIFTVFGEGDSFEGAFCDAKANAELERLFEEQIDEENA